MVLKDSSNEIWSEPEKFQALKDAIEDLYPEILIPIIDTSLSTNSASYEYNLPTTIERVEKVSIQPDSFNRYQAVPFFLKNSSTGNILVLKQLYNAGKVIEIIGGIRIPLPSAIGDTLQISIDCEKLVRLGVKIELYKTVLLDKGKMNQFSARETETTEVDVINMIDLLKKDFQVMKDQVISIFTMQFNRV